MNLRKLLVYQKEIMGVEIDNRWLRLINLTSGQASRGLKIKKWVEVKLDSHVIENGEVQDEKNFSLLFSN